MNSDESIAEKIKVVIIPKLINKTLKDNWILKYLRNFHLSFSNAQSKIKTISIPKIPITIPTKWLELILFNVLDKLNKVVRQDVA